MVNTEGIKKLYKSRTERMIDGVCGGVAKYFNLDPTLVRIAWVLLTFLGGSGILLYIVAMIVMPKEPYIIPEYGAGPTGAGWYARVRIVDCAKACRQTDGGGVCGRGDWSIRSTVAR